MSGPQAACVSLDSSSPEFWSDLQTLDSLTPRTLDTLCLYCVRAGRVTAAEILANNDPAADPPPGYRALVSALAGDGEAATSAELVVATPTQPLRDPDRDSLGLGPRRGSSLDPGTPGPQRHSALLMSRRPRKEKQVERQRIVVAWLERPEDSAVFPLRQLVPAAADTVSLVLQLVPVPSSGLLRVRSLAAATGQPSTVPPLVDGVVVSPAVVGRLIRSSIT